MVFRFKLRCLRFSSNTIHESLVVQEDVGRSVDQGDDAVSGLPG